MSNDKQPTEMWAVIQNKQYIEVWPDEDSANDKVKALREFAHSKSCTCHKVWLCEEKPITEQDLADACTLSYGQGHRDAKAETTALLQEAVEMLEPLTTESCLAGAVDWQIKAADIVTRLKAAAEAGEQREEEPGVA